MKKIIPNKLQLQMIKDFASKGYAITHIAEEVSIDRSAIKRILNEYNIELIKTSTNKKGAKIIWTPEMEEELRSMYSNSKITLDDMVKSFNMSESSIVKKARSLGMNKVKDIFDWSSHKIRLLKKHYASEDYTVVSIAELFETTEAVIRSKAKQLGLSKIKNKPYSDEEVAWMVKNKEAKSLEEIATILGRSKDAIKIKLVKLGEIETINRRKVMPNTEEFKLDIGNPMHSNAVLSRKYGVSSTTISNWRKQLFGNFKIMVDTWRCKTTSEMDFEDILEELDLAYIYQKEILGWRIDFYLGMKTIVEIYGSYHHKLEKVKLKDERAINQLKEAGYNVIVIWDYELKNKEKIKQLIQTEFGSPLMGNF